ncbi:MAG: Ribulose-phosphate 3-epimerase [Elusimicrobia bacterium]|nr:Ribulose-phosphate 3-epimerase [Elusimicrobiota bacterium]
MSLVAPSILSADFARLAEEAKLMESAGADWLHVDVMDGHFVPNLTIGPVVVKSLKKHTHLPLDVHLMITDPLKYAEPFAKAGAWGLTFHIEAVENPGAVISEIKRLGVKPGISIKPGTPASAVIPYLGDLNVVLIMTVEPGFGGQSFMAEMIPKIREIAAAIKLTHVSCKIEVDGGIDAVTGAQCIEAGAQVLVAGNSVFNSPDPVKAVQALKSL